MLLWLLACIPTPEANGSVEIRLDRELSLSSSELVGESSKDYPWNRGPGLAAADVDRDGWLDLVLALPYEQSLLFRNRGGILEKDPVPLPGAVGVAAADLNGDRAAELILTRWRGEPDLLLQNDGEGNFQTVELPDSSGESRTPAFADLEGDGDLDLVTSGFSSDEDPDPHAGPGDGHQLFIQEDGVFLNVTAERLPAEAVQSLAHHIAWADVDGDEAPDLVVANDHLGINRLLRNDRLGHFGTLENTGIEQAMQAMGVAVGDPNGDGIADLLVSDIESLRLWEGDGQGGFVELTQAVSLNPPRSIAPTWGLAWVDLDLDGQPEAVATAGNLIWNEEPVADEQDLILRRGAAGWTEVGPPEQRNSRAVVAADFDRDGRPDLATAGILFLDLWYNRTEVPAGFTLSLEAGGTEGIGACLLPEQGPAQWLWPSTTYSSSAPEWYLPAGPYQIRIGGRNIEVKGESGHTNRIPIQ